MGFSKSVKTKAMIACGRCCCLCHRFFDVLVECHHIVQEADGGKNTFENCIPLCVVCHGRVGHYNDWHPRGTKFASDELRAHRDACFELVKRGVLPAEVNEGKVQPVISASIVGLRMDPWEVAASIKVCNTGSTAHSLKVRVAHSATGCLAYGERDADWMPDASGMLNPRTMRARHPLLADDPVECFRVVMNSETHFPFQVHLTAWADHIRKTDRWISVSKDELLSGETFPFLPGEFPAGLDKRIELR